MDGVLYQGDNLRALRDLIAPQSVDLVYLDPPFMSDAEYRKACGAGFSDVWRWDAAAFDAAAADPDCGPALIGFRALLGEGPMLAYLAAMAPRLAAIRTAMRPTASLYLHCDASAAHALRMLCDALFGAANFRREIIWKSGWVSGFKARARNWARNHDVILYYVRDMRADWVFNKAFRPHAPGYRRRGGGANPLGVALDDVWDEPELYSPNIKSLSREKRGWPTQKPEALLRRIIAASSNPGDVTLDPYCGSGTTLAAAQALGRRWIGMEVAPEAVAIAALRLTEAGAAPTVISTG